MNSHIQVGHRVPEAPRTSICILAYGQATMLNRCLRSLRQVTQANDEVEIVVLANQVRPEELALVDDQSRLVIASSETNLGFGAGNEYAATLARGEYLVFLNDDSTTEPDFLQHLMVTVEADPAIAAVGSRIALPDGTLQEAGSVIWNDGSTTHIGLGLQVDTEQFNYLRDVDYVSANGFLIRRSAWDAVGGFDDRYHPAYFEDVDLCMSLRAHGYRVLYEPRSLIHHLESQSTSTRYREFLLARNRAQFLEKWRSELAHFGKRDANSPRAIQSEIQRARGHPRQLLVIAREFVLGDFKVDLSQLLTQIEAWGADGWATTLLLDKSCLEMLDFRPDRSGFRDRLIDLGVEIFCDMPRRYLEQTTKRFDAIVLDRAQSTQDIRQAIGSFHPQAQQLASMTDGPIREPSVSTTTSTLKKLGRSTRDGGGPTERAAMKDSRDLEAIASPQPSEEMEFTQHALDLANAELRVRTEYAQSLEAELSNLERRLASEPSVKIRGYVSNILGPKWSRRLVRWYRRHPTTPQARTTDH